MNQTKWLLAQLILVSACGRVDSEDALFSSQPNQREVPGNNSNIAPTEDETVIQTDRIIEEFDSLRQIAEAEKSNVTVDINQGLLSLPLRYSVSDVTAEDASPSVTRITEYTSSVVSQTCIVIEDNVKVSAPDSIELTATDTIRIAGNLTAGDGGITLVANNSIHIDGTLMSTGPIRIIVPQPSGTIAITGLVKTLSNESDKTPNIAVITRGSVEVYGELKTSDAAKGRTGDVIIVSYGPIAMQGNQSKLVTGVSRGGDAGHITLSSESNISMNTGAYLQAGAASSNSERDQQNLGGIIDVRAQSLNLSESVRWKAGNCRQCNAGSINITVEQDSKLGRRTHFEAGHGRNGGDVSIVAGHLVVDHGTTIRAGEGHVHAGRTFFDTTTDLELKDDVLIYGGTGQCVDGGPVVGLVGGQLKIGNSSWFKGGSSVLGNTNCVSAARGGDVQFFCSEIVGSFDTSTKPGNGSPDGDVTLVVNPDYERPIPNPHPQSFGFLESKTFDRGPENSEALVTLSSMLSDLPDGTRLDIMIAGASDSEGPFSEWFVLDDNMKATESITGFRFIRYRIEVHGRTLDTPVLDRFEIDLAGRN